MSKRIFTSKGRVYKGLAVEEALLPHERPGTVLTLQGKGVPRLGNPVARGNHEVTVKVQLPTKLSGEERQLLEQLAGHHTNKGQRHHHKSGLFGGLFGGGG